ncbi:MAG TPA: cytochrome c biogenesis protein CcsA, partial [Pirellulaceae bacterium]|nr:cytochrome c biogenesis protein CcsA [Pirellulaceae bacterium]
RNTARQLSNYEFISDRFGKRQPAIRWFADWIYDAPGCDEYQLIRITDLSVLEALGMKPRSGFKYTVAELAPMTEQINQLTEAAIKLERSQLTTTQKRLIDLRVQLNRLISLRRAFTDPFVRLAPDDVFSRLQMANMLASEVHLPRLIPDETNPDQPWRILTHVWIERAFNELADRFHTRSLPELVSAVTQSVIIAPLREQLIQERMIDEILSDPEVVKLIGAQLEQTGISDIRRRLLANWELFPAQVYEQLYPVIAPAIDRLLDEKRHEFLEQIDGLIRAPLKWTGNEVPEFDNPYARAWMDMAQEYRDGNGSAFNALVGTCYEYLNYEHPVEYRPSTIRTEWVYNAFAPLYQATTLYLMAFLLSALGWIFWPRGWNRAATCVLLLGLSVHVAAIIMRVMISGRPPVTNLYSSFVFVPAVGVVALMMIERLTRLGIANGMAAVAGAASLLWAWSITVSDQNATGDTFTVMEAVLDTQFWLSTHVIMICLGYGGTIAAGLLGAGYLISGILTKSISGQREQRLAATLYGTICFALLCSFFGTVLGGLWADDSWGRFWGWDPKENGALMIVLWNAVSLHARWGGMIRHRQMAALAVLGSIVTIWSWEGVNQLGQGLHSYGFSQDRLVGVGIFVAVHLIVAALVFVPKRCWRSADAYTR